MAELTKRQLFLYKLYEIAPEKKLFSKNKKKFSLPELEKEIDGIKRSGYTRRIIEEFVDKQIIVFTEIQKELNGWVRLYEIDTKKLEDYIMNTEWYTLTKELIDTIEPPVLGR